MGGARNDEELFVIASKQLEGIFPELAGMRLLAMDDQDGVPDFASVSE